MGILKGAIYKELKNSKTTSEGVKVHFFHKIVVFHLFKMKMNVCNEKHYIFMLLTKHVKIVWNEGN